MKVSFWIKPHHGAADACYNDIDIHYICIDDNINVDIDNSNDDTDIYVI